MRKPALLVPEPYGQPGGEFSGSQTLSARSGPLMPNRPQTVTASGPTIADPAKPANDSFQPASEWLFQGLAHPLAKYAGTGDASAPSAGEVCPVIRPGRTLVRSLSGRYWPFLQRVVTIPGDVPCLRNSISAHRSRRSSRPLYIFHALAMVILLLCALCRVRVPCSPDFADRTDHVTRDFQ